MQVKKQPKSYGVQVLKQGIETNPRNYTRFVIVARAEHPETSSPNKASLVFSLRNKPGALFLVLKILAERSLNMTKLESRPILGKPWEYMFYVDVEVPQDSSLFYETAEALENEAASFRILGVYRG